MLDLTHITFLHYSECICALSLLLRYLLSWWMNSLQLHRILLQLCYGDNLWPLLSSAVWKRRFDLILKIPNLRKSQNKFNYNLREGKRLADFGGWLVRSHTTFPWQNIWMHLQNQVGNFWHSTQHLAKEAPFGGTLLLEPVNSSVVVMWHEPNIYIPFKYT